MRSLFSKILLWFVATVAITSVGFVVITASTINATDRRPLIARVVAYQLEEARHAYETSGRQGLARFMERFRAMFETDAALTDASGKDLLSGEDRSELIERARQRVLPFLWVRRQRAVVARESPDGKYWFFLLIPREQAGYWFLSLQHLWQIGIVILLCYGLALYLTSPLRKLQGALERFGQGDFSARAGSDRRDELGELARTFDRMAERIQTLLAAERRLLLDISHELRSPLARLGVAVELARSGEDREAALNRIQKEADRLNALVGELLEVTRVEGDPQTLRTEPVRLDEVLRQVVDDCSIEAAARSCSLELKSAAPATVEGDGELLRRALENVIRNAIRYAPAATAVEITMNGGPGKAVIRIRDYGPGVPEEALPRIFDAFYRVDSDRNRASGGTGLGLAIARRAVELHKGKLQARNANPGLLVEMELPVAAV
jgi:signal transduction histidine kinase